ncbi:MAG: hypothetical protein HYX68_02385 [Planctomycetes bacterium]|jgi:hypothetical protein|nr:hypothetical protein [Planctomycetota bacterium]
MAELSDQDPASARSRLLDLLRSHEWKISERALKEGKIALRWLQRREPTEVEMVDYIIAVLTTNIVLRCAPQGNPPGSTGIAWQMTDSKNVFIKLRIAGGFGDESSEEYAYIQSIHESIHPA